MSGADQGRYDPSLKDFLTIIWNERRLVALSSLIAVGIFAALGFLLPPSYRATTTLIPTSDRDRNSVLGKIGIDLGQLGIQTGGRNDSPLMYPEIIGSRRILSAVLDSVLKSGEYPSGRRLIDVIEPKGKGPERRERALRKVAKLIDASVDRRTGVLTIRCTMPGRATAAEVANELRDRLQEFLIQSLTAQATSNRVFIEGRRNETRAALARQEEILRDFRDRNRRFGNAPSLQLEEGRLTRLVREQEEVYLTLSREYEVAKIDEHRNVPILSVLDPAEPPVFRHFPKRRLLAVIGLGVGLLLGSLVAIWRRM